MSAHYKVQLNFTEDAIKASDEAIERLREFILKVKDANGKESDGKNIGDVASAIKKAKEDFEKNMDDDINISGALASVFDFVKEINKLLSENKISKQNGKEILDFMSSIDKVFGVLEFDEEKAPEEIMKIVEEREEARKKKDFKTSDALRDKINAKGWLLSDTKDGPKLKKKN